MKANNLERIISAIQSGNPDAALKIARSALAGLQTEITEPETFNDNPMFEDEHKIVYSQKHDGIICSGI